MLMGGSRRGQRALLTRRPGDAGRGGGADCGAGVRGEVSGPVFHRRRMRRGRLRPPTDALHPRTPQRRSTAKQGGDTATQRGSI